MARFSIPNRQGQIRQLNINRTLGELDSTWNIDLHTVPGKIKLARPLKQVASATELGNERVQALAEDSSGNVYALTESTLYHASNSADDGFATWTSADTTPDMAEDAVVFQNQLVISTSTNLDAYNLTPGGSFGTYTEDWWTARNNTALTTNNPTPTVPRVLEVARIGTETLVVLDGSNIRAYVGGITSDPVTNLTMEVDSIFTACCFKSSIRRGWVGTFTQFTDQAYVFEWDVASTNYVQGYPIGARAALAMELDDDAPVIITERGEVKRFNNAGFTTIAQFPFARDPKFANNMFSPINTFRPIHPKGVKRVERTLFVYVNWNTNSPLDERSPAGLWAVNLDTGSLSHLASPANDTSFARSGPILINGSGFQDITRIFIAADRDIASDEEGVWMEDLSDSSANYGYFTTVELEAESVQDVFDEIVQKAQLGTNDSMIVKYRTQKDTSYPIVAEDVVWASTTQFNTTVDLSAVKTRFDAGHRDEVEVIKGTTAGRLAHITNITKSASTYGVTIDESIGTAAGTSDVRFDNWSKVDNPFTAEDGQLKRLGIGASDTWCQFKVELRGQAGLPEIRGIMVKSNNKASL